MCCFIDAGGHKLNIDGELSPTEIHSHYATRALCTFIFAALITVTLVVMGTAELPFSASLITCMTCASLIALAAYVKTAIDAHLAYGAFQKIKDN